MTTIGLLLLILLVNAISIAVYSIIKFGVGKALRLVLAAIKSPRLVINKIKAHRADKKFIKENKAYWEVGQELDKIDALKRYKKDERVISHPSVKAFELERKNKQNKKDIKANKKAGKSKSAKQFEKITK